MARADGRIEKGQRLSSAISAKAWNRAQQAADVVLGVQPGFKAQPIEGYRAPYSTILVLNNGYQSDAPRWSPVLLMPTLETRPVGDATDESTVRATSQFQEMPVMWTTNATSSVPTSIVGVLLEPLPVDKIGPAAVAGMCQTRIKKTEDGGKYARFVQESSNYTYGRFETDRFSGFRIVWMQDVSVGATGWALINLSGYAVEEIVFAKVTQRLTIGTTQLSPVGQARLMYVKNGQWQESTTVVDIKTNVSATIEAGKYVWLKNPLSCDAFGNDFMAWSVISSENNLFRTSGSNFWAAQNG